MCMCAQCDVVCVLKMTGYSVAQMKLFLWFYTTNAGEKKLNTSKPAHTNKSSRL